MSDAEAESCTHTRWGTLTGLDPALLAELQEHKRCRLEREKMQEDSQLVSPARSFGQWVQRIRAALQRSEK